MQPERPVQQKTVNVKVDVRHHAIPPMLKRLALWMLIIIGAAAGTVMFAYEPGSPADIAGTIAFIAWNIAAAEAIMGHIISKQQDTRKEVIEEITRAQKTHLIIK